MLTLHNLYSEVFYHVAVVYDETRYTLSQFAQGQECPNASQHQKAYIVARKISNRGNTIPVGAVTQSQDKAQRKKAGKIPLHLLILYRNKYVMV
jgi:hypothetical protein